MPKSPTKIVHISTVHTWNDTRIYQRMCRSLAACGYDVHWVVPCAADDPGGPVPSGDAVVTIHPLPPPRGRLGRATLTAWRALRAAQRVRGDVYHFHDPELIWVGLTLRLLGNRVVYDVHEDIVGDALEKPWLPTFIRPLAGRCTALVEALAARWLSGVVTAGDDIQQRLGRHTNKCLAVHNYPSLADFPSRPATAPASPPQIVFLGGINETNVPVNLVKALELLPKSLDCRLVWGGKRADPTVLEKLAQQAGWARVDYRGFVPFDQVQPLMSDATAAVVLYANAPNNFSIRSNRLFETMAMALPIIGPAYGDWPEFFQQHPCGVPVDPDQPEEIAAAIEQVGERSPGGCRSWAGSAELRWQLSFTGKLSSCGCVSFMMPCSEPCDACHRAGR